jgi:peptidoglycan/xylan/chitin deacetylase (PgdA/CDA1 family)
VLGPHGKSQSNRAPIKLQTSLPTDTSVRVPDVLVLCYHAVSDRWPAALAVPPSSLTAQLEFLVERGYRGATFREAVTAPPHSRTLAVTFDDAFLSVLEHAEPVLSSLGLPGTVFAVTDFADSGRPLSWQGIEQWRGGPHDVELRGLDWVALRELAGRGWEVGSHTCAHPRLTRLDDVALAAELRASRAACERELGGACTSVAYPYGDVDRRVVSAAASAGYTAGAALPARPTVPSALEWPRIGVYNIDSLQRFRLKASPAVRSLRRAFARFETAARRGGDR